MTTEFPQLAFFALVGVGTGLALLWRGFGSYRTATRIGDTGSSRIGSLAAGEVRVSGVVEPAELTVISPLQSVTSVWYRAKVTKSQDEGETVVFEEERGTGFRVRDETGSIRVFPQGALIDVPNDYDERDGMFGELPIGLAPRYGPAFGPGALMTEADRQARIDALLTVHPATGPSGYEAIDGGGLAPVAGMAGGLLGLGPPLDAIRVGSGRKHYREARVEPGDVVTILGTAVPFRELPDPLGADSIDGGMAATFSDPEVAGDLAEAREAGLLVSKAEAWGNAAIPGFGIGRPVSTPELDPGAHALPLATPDERARVERTFDLAPDVLVLASTPDVRLLMAAGAPGEAVGRQERQFLIGLLGAMLAIGSALALAILIGGLQ